MSNQMTSIDYAGDVRAGEEIDTHKLDAYLKAHLEPLDGEIAVKQFPSGASNLTYLIAYQNTELVLRRPPIGTKAKSAHDMIREATVLQTLKPLYPYVPKVLHKCQDHSVLGCDFFVMEKLTGMIPRRDFPPDLNLDKTKVREICLSGIDKLIELHEISAQDPAFKVFGKGSGYVKRQIMGWSDRYEKARTSDTPSFEKISSWLKINMPDDIKTCVIHNDFRFDNLVFDSENISTVIGVLDWEMATLGDPLMDLGNSLAYWVEANDPPPLLQTRLQPTHTDGMLTRKEMVDYYLAKTNIIVDNFTFYEVYGIFRLAVIVQQIYYRFFHGQTQDQRFAGFGQFVTLLESRCLSLLDN